MTSMQLSMTLASMYSSVLSEFVTSLKSVKSNTTVPYIEAVCEVPAEPMVAVGVSRRRISRPSVLLDGLVSSFIAICCSNYSATSLITKDV